MTSSSIKAEPAWTFDSLKWEERDRWLFGTDHVMREIEKLEPAIDGGSFAQRWYHDMIPHMNSPKFASFLVGSRELSRLIFRKKEVRFLLTSDSESALADQDNGIIYLPESIFGEKTFRNITKYNERSDLGPEMTAVANGFILHESAHFAKSPKTILDCFLAFSKSPNGEELFRDAGFRDKRLRLPAPLATFLNVIEDLYIEQWVVDEFPPLAPFIEAAHEFHFNENVLNQRLNEFSARIEKIPEISGVEGTAILIDEIRSNWRKLLLLNILIVFKHQRYLKHPTFSGIVEPFLKDFRLAQHADSLADRGEIAFRCFTRLFDLDPEKMKVEVVSTLGLGIAEPSEQMDSKGRESGAKPSAGDYRNDDENKKKAAAVADDERHGKVKMTSPSADPRCGGIAKELERINRTLEEQLQESALGTVPPTKVIEDIQKSKDPRELILPQFQGLGTKLRYAWTTNYTPGAPQKRGPVLVNQRLYRILTDGKLFSYREKRKASGRNYEIGILVDSSGSMTGLKIQEAMMAAYTAWRSLVSARVSVCLMAHTTVQDGRMDECPVIYLIAPHGFHRIDEVRQRTAFFAYESWGLMKNNYDGFAIKKAAEIGFTRDPDRKRFLFVISDGEPAGSVYHGRGAIDHTARQVQAARERGIDVISITVSLGAYAVNDRIYGAKKNVKASNPAVLDKLIEAMFIPTRRGA